MKRYYLAPVVKASFGPSPEVYQVKLPKIGGYSAMMPTGKNGVPLFDWALVSVESNDHGAVVASPGVVALPDMPKASALSALALADRARLRTALLARGVSDVALDGGTFGDLLDALARKLEPGLRPQDLPSAKVA